MLVHCTRPHCPRPQNDLPELEQASQRRSRINQKFCTACGMPLILRGRYVAERVLGRGGFGAAYLARDLDTPGWRHCVIKQFLPNVSDPKQLAKAQELFEREATVLEDLGQHAQIPDLLAFFEEEVPSQGGAGTEQYFYLVQEFIDGDTLEDELLQQGRFSEEQVRQVLRELLPVLQYVHDRGSIHRDIKLSNIMRQHPSKTKFPGQGHLYLLDFGAVKQVSHSSATPRSTGIYTPHYAPPEQSRGEQVFPSSDLYALAVTCIVLLTGKGPDQLFDAYNNRWNWHPYAQVSPQLRDVLDRMLKAAPSDRFASAKDVEAALSTPSTPPPAPPPATAVSVAPAAPPAPPVNIATPATTTPRPKPVRQRSPRAPLPALKILMASGFTGFEMTAIGLMCYGLMTTWGFPLSISAGLIGAIFALLVFLQYRRIVEHWEQLILGGLTAAALYFVPVLQAGLGAIPALLVCLLGGLACVVLGNVFLLVYSIISRFA